MIKIAFYGDQRAIKIMYNETKYQRDVVRTGRIRTPNGLKRS
jgi:hypothetical protein